MQPGAGLFCERDNLGKIIEGTGIDLARLGNHD